MRRHKFSQFMRELKWFLSSASVGALIAVLNFMPTKTAKALAAQLEH